MSELDKILRGLSPSDDDISDWSRKVWSSSLSEVTLPGHVNPEHVARQLKKLNKFLTREPIEANQINETVLALVAALALELSPFATVNQIDDEPTVTRALIAIETYFRLLALDRAEACNVFHPTLYESAFQILSNVLDKYSHPEKRTFILTVIAKSVFTSPGAALAELFEKFTLPEQYLDSTVKHIFAYYSKCCLGEFDQEQIDRAIIQLGVTKNETLFVEVSLNLCMLVGGKLLPPGSSTLNKYQSIQQKRAYRTMLVIISRQPHLATNWLTRLADVTPPRQVCARLYFDAAKDIVKQLDEEQQNAVVSQCTKLLRYKNVRIRANMLILAKAIMSLYETECKLSPDKMSSLLSSMVARTRDSSTNVQCRALLYVAELFQGQMADVNESLLAPGGLQPTHLQRRSTSSVRSGASDLTTNSEAMRRTVCETILFNTERLGQVVNSFSGAADRAPIQIIQSFIQSPNVYVRKATLDFTKALVLQRLIPIDEVADIYDAGCRDCLLSVRSHALSVFSALVFEFRQLDSTLLDMSKSLIDVETPADKMIRFWLKTMIGMIEDRERVITDKAYGLLYENVLAPLISYENHFIYRVLAALNEVELEDFAVNMGQLVMQFAKDAKIGDRQWELLSRRMMSLIETDQSSTDAVAVAYPWVILGFIHTNKPSAININKVLAIWTDSMGSLIKTSPAAALWSTRLIREIVKVRPSEQGNVITLIIQEFMKVMSMSTHLMKVISSLFRDIDDDTNKKWIVEQIFTIKNLAKLLAKIEDSPDDECPKLVAEASFRTCVMSVFYDYYKREDQLKLCDLIIQPLATDDIEPKFARYTDSAMWSLGRVCCQDHQEAERIVKFFGHQLKMSTRNESSVAAKVGALGALADLCRVKTQLTDKFIDVIATMMEDRSVVVVTTALKLMTYMLRQDYIKMRSSLLSRMLILAANESKQSDRIEIKQMSQYCLTHVIAPRHEDLFINHFTQIMILCTGATQLQNPGGDNLLSTQTQKSVDQFGGFFVGDRNRQNRRKIYDFCITNMTPRQQLKLLAKLKFEVFEAPQRNSDLNTSSPEMVEVLHDALVLVHQQPQLQFPFSTNSGGGGDNGDEEFFSESQATQANQAARSKGQKEACSQTRKAYIERSLFGELYDLRETLRAHKSGATIFINKLMKSLMVELPDLKDLDPKYGELEAEIERQIESWNELGIKEPEQLSMDKEVKNTKNQKRRRSILHESVAELNSMCSRRSNASFGIDGDKENITTNCPNSTPFPDKPQLGF